MTDTYQRAKITGSAHRAAADHGASHGIAYPAVTALQKKSQEEDELQMKSITQLAKPDDEELQMKSVAQLAKPEEEELQMKAANATGDITQRKENVAPPKTNHTGMPDQLRSGIENLSGFSMDDVKVHYNSSQPAQLNALAYAQGTNIHIAPGQERHLPHEAWHVVQQKQGRVRPTMQMKDVAINDDKGLEREADVMGGEAMQLISRSQTMINPFSVTTIPKIRHRVVLQGLFLPQAKRDIKEDQITLKTEWFLAKDEDRLEDKSLIARMQVETAVRPEVIMVTEGIPPLKDEVSAKVRSGRRKPENLRLPAPAGSVYLDQLPKHGTNQTRSFKSSYPHTTVLLGAINPKTNIVKIKDFHYSLGEKSTRFVWKSRGSGNYELTGDTSEFNAEGIKLLKKAYADVSNRAKGLGCFAIQPSGI